MKAAVGISGFSIYLPPYQVNLADWCRWTGENPEKIASVVGDSFRLCGERENVYTMAASAVIRLIRDHDVDPGRVGMLALGTESSTDNSAGAVIVRGMVDQALAREGLPPLSRHCEVPEFKHACLGGMYALKAAWRYQLADAGTRQSIVVSADIAEYARGTTGEPTQGAGAVAALVESHPRLLAVDLTRCGSASDYRGADFRKPFSRFRGQNGHGRLKDFPVFNGRYSTTCYLDEILLAMQDAVDRQSIAGGRAYLDGLAAVFLHRPYQRMPETGWALLVLYLLAIGDRNDRAVLDELGAGCGIDARAIAAELAGQPRVADLLPGGDVYPGAQRLAKAMRNSTLYAELVDGKLALGREVMRQAGNLYAAALPAWLAAGLEQAAAEGRDLTGAELLAIGYGSGDAAEVIPLTVMPGWRDAALATRFHAALADPSSLSETEYYRLHDDGSGACRTGDFFIERVGTANAAFQDGGIEYYRYQPGRPRWTPADQTSTP